MADIFGDDSLFSEFERDRDTQNIFIQYDQDESGTENRSRIIFTGAESDSGESDTEDAAEERKEITPDTAATAADDNEETRKSMELEETCDVKESSEECEGSSAPQSTTYQENFEKNKLRQFARIFDSTRCVAEEQSPGVQVVFQNNKFAKKYRSRIEQFVISLAQHADKKDFTKTATDLSTKATTVSTCVDINDKLPMEKRNTRMWQAHGIIGCAQFYNGFMVDSRGWLHDEDEPKELGDGEIPKYFQVFEEVFPPKEDTADQSLKPPPRPKDACFNCGGDHRLNECVAPKDHNRIRAKRQERMESRVKKSNPGRYHEDPELDPSRIKFQAGTISDGLRKAMGLSSDQLPSYIYRMRLFGYPPGWLLEANRKASSLAMYDQDGRETNLRGESLEDGEYNEQASTSELFDVSKIIEYPGFTVSVPMGFMDESETQGLPPIQQHQLKKTLMDDVAQKEAAKKRSLEDEETKKVKKIKTDDMDIVGEDEQSPVPQKTSTPAEGKKKGQEEGESSGSPTIDNLQEQYQKLVQELDSEGDAVMANGNSSAAASSASGTEPSSASAAADRSLSELREKNFSFSSMSSISKDFGTPILVREKSIKALPAAEKFSQGVEEHIPFENLPDSVGTFEKMRNLFTLIRNKVKKPKK
ncbi:hypothetical protein ACOMHN_056751 [Nucella lapillus]